MKAISVECKFMSNGAVQVRRVLLEDTWLPVGQGRQWTDEAGRHVLVMLPNQQVRELLLRVQTLDWVVLPAPNQPHMVA